MIKRDITSVFKDAVKTHPVVTVFGPRQSGKTTLVRNVLPKYGYVNLENPKERRLATEDPEGFFAHHPAPLIIDIRDNVGVEVDLVVEQNRRLHLMEIKGAMTPDNLFGLNMAKIADRADEVDSCNVIYSGESWPLKGGGRFVNFETASSLLRNLA